MDLFLDGRHLRLVARGLEKSTNYHRHKSKLASVFSMLVALTCPSAPASANTLVESYVKFNQELDRALMQPYHDSKGLQLQSIEVEYQQQPVSFQYQMWRLRPNSVCLPLKKSSLLKYSQCTEAASQLFSETCQKLKHNPTESLFYPQYMRLYCNAAASYEPGVAKVRRSAPMEQSAEQRQLCSMLILKATRTREPSDIWERDQVCETGG